MAFDFTKILSTSVVEKRFLEDFPKFEGEWKTVSIKGTKLLKDYISLVDSLRKVPEDFETYKQARESYNSLKSNVESLEGLVYKMINFVQESRKEVKRTKREGMCGLTDLDFLLFMERKVDLYQKEYDVKSTIFLGLNENRNDLVMSNYIINWESNIYQKEMNELELEIERRLELDTQSKTL